MQQQQLPDEKIEFATIDPLDGHVRLTSQARTLLESLHGEESVAFVAYLSPRRAGMSTLLHKMSIAPVDLASTTGLFVHSTPVRGLDYQHKQPMAILVLEMTIGDPDLDSYQESMLFALIRMLASTVWINTISRSRRETARHIDQLNTILVGAVNIPVHQQVYWILRYYHANEHLDNVISEPNTFHVPPPTQVNGFQHLAGLATMLGMIQPTFVKVTQELSDKLRHETLALSDLNGCTHCPGNLLPHLVDTTLDALVDALKMIRLSQQELEEVHALLSEHVLNDIANRIIMPYIKGSSCCV
jgi:hypothetical protein